MDPAARLALATSCLQDRRSTLLELRRNGMDGGSRTRMRQVWRLLHNCSATSMCWEIGAPGGNRTLGLLPGGQALCWLSYRRLVDRKGVAPFSRCLQGSVASTEHAGPKIGNGKSGGSDGICAHDLLLMSETHNMPCSGAEARALRARAF